MPISNRRALSDDVTNFPSIDYNKIFIDTTLPNIGDRWKELLIPIPLDRNKTLEISNKIKDTFTQKWQALDKLSFLRDEFGDIVT